MEGSGKRGVAGEEECGGEIEMEMGDEGWGESWP